jgi:hypothetical protein
MKYLLLFLLLSPLLQAQASWHVTSTKNPVDGVETITALLPSSDVGRYAKPYLVIRTRGLELDVYVTTGEVVDEETVRFRIDGEAPVAQLWSTAKGLDALFSPEPLSLLGKLRTAKNFYIEYTPFDRNARPIRFHLPQRFPRVISSKMAIIERERQNEFARVLSERQHLYEYCRGFVGGPVYEWPSKCSDMRLELEGDAIALPNLAK